MKTTLKLASALFAMSVAGASAADLRAPAAEPADYVKICDAYGAGFFYIPGGQTCMKIGGYVRADYFIQRGSNKGLLANGFATRGGNGTMTNVRADLQVDTRTNTDFGLLRTFTELRFNEGSAGYGQLAVQRAFIQWGGLTAGRAASFFDYFTGMALHEWWAVPASDSSRTNLLAYTFSFGNGVTATLALEDGTTRRVAFNGGRLFSASGTEYGGHKWPDVVANIRVEQSWGSAQLMGALHHNYPNKTAAGVGGTQPSSEVGWAIGGGLTFNLPMFAAGDQFVVQAAYAQGAVHYVNSFPLAAMADFQATVNTADISQSTAWSVSAGFLHNWSPTLSTSISGGYYEFDHQGIAADHTGWVLAGNVAWVPVSGLTLAVEVEYANVDTVAAGGDDDILGMFRIQRDF